MFPLSAPECGPRQDRPTDRRGAFCPDRGGTVLMVEDEPEIAHMFRHVFQRANLAMTAAASGREALRLFERTPQAYPLLFVDYCLPDMEGTDLCDHLRTIVPGLPVLLASGSDRRDAYLQLKLGGPTVFMRKPYLPIDVVWQARSLMRILQAA